jgi:hypothetical protein
MTINPEYVLGTIVLAGSAGGILIKLIKWAYQRYRRNETTHIFVYDMATNHLPHLHHTQRLIADKLGVEVTEPPPIQFIDFKKLDKKGE